MPIDIKLIQRSFVLQQETSDCGAACLLSVVKYYRGANTIENIRRLSGTNITGTTLLGLYQAAKEIGFDATGCETDIETLTAYEAPCILHMNGNHFMVCYGAVEKNGELVFMIGDPAKGVDTWTKQELAQSWQTKKCLELLPKNTFKQATDIKKQKREWIKTLLRQDMPLLSGAAGIGVAIAILGLVMAIFSQHLIDEILPKKQFMKLNLSIALVLLLLLAKEGFSFLRQFFLLRQSKDFNTRITDHFYTHLLRLPKPFFDTRKIGELTARLNDTTRIQRVISQIAGNVAIDVLVTCTSIGFLFVYSWKVAVVAICVLPFYFLLIRNFNKNILDGQRKVMTGYAASESNYISTLQGIEAIKNFEKQNLFGNANKTLYENYQDKIFLLGKIQVRLSFIANVFGITFLVGILAFCSYNVLHGQMKTGELMAVLSMCSNLLPSVANLALIAIPVNEAKIAFDRMFEFTGIRTEEQHEIKNELHALFSLQVKNISFRFAGRKQLLKNVSFEIAKGQIIAIVGENGCGKSTLTHILQRHYANENGEIIVNELESFGNIPLQQWRNITAVVPQHVHIFNTTVLENIAFEDAAKKPGEVLKHLQQLGFSSFIESLPQSFMTMVGEEGINLSGGQKQMIALARALYHQPQLLILDEATASMDRLSENFVKNLLLCQKQKMAVIFITHKLHILRNFADKIYILENGMVTANGSHEHLLSSTSKNLYSSYWSELR